MDKRVVLSGGDDRQVVRVVWDSDHFGFEVGRIVSPDCDDVELSDFLRQSQAAGFKLVYWMAAADRSPTAMLLEQFHGRLVDRKTTYAASLASLPESDAPAPPQYRIEEHCRGPASSTLKSLAIQSGVYSRYRVDPCFPTHVFQNLYETWIDRSVRREIADVVLTAVNDANKVIGLLTLAVVEGEGQIGLLGVDESCRRLGIARQLINASHQWLKARAIKNVNVVTQGDNVAACTFYERCGYRMRDRKNVFHFWPPESAALQ
jgi:dTDP-4-amino-4,6-dideoxy-D-galactose acyltransferase